MSNQQYYSAKYIVENSKTIHKNSVLVINEGFVVDIISLETFAEKKSKDYTQHVYEILNERLSKSDYICEDYSIADIAIWPWVARFERHEIQIDEYPNVLKWYLKILKRPAVVKGYNIAGEFHKIPVP